MTSMRSDEINKMIAGNEILDRILKCFDEIDKLSPEEKEAIADRYWDFVDQHRL